MTECFSQSNQDDLDTNYAIYLTRSDLDSLAELDKTLTKRDLNLFWRWSPTTKMHDFYYFKDDTGIHIESFLRVFGENKLHLCRRFGPKTISIANKIAALLKLPNNN